MPAGGRRSVKQHRGCVKMAQGIILLTTQSKQQKTRVTTTYKAHSLLYQYTHSFSKLSPSWQMALPPRAKGHPYHLWETLFYVVGHCSWWNSKNKQPIAVALGYPHPQMEEEHHQRHHALQKQCPEIPELRLTWTHPLPEDFLLWYQKASACFQRKEAMTVLPNSNTCESHQQPAGHNIPYRCSGSRHTSAVINISLMDLQSTQQ